MSEQLGAISVFLAKEGITFDQIIDVSKVPSSDTANFKIRDFAVEGYPVKFLCVQKTSKSENPAWLDFVNSQFEDDDEKINFPSSGRRPSGLLLIEIQNRVLAAAFGTSGKSLLKDFCLVSDFGIRTAMNMCGNSQLRQTKSSTHSVNTQNIDRQLSKPSDSFSFGLNETEFLEYISGHLPDNSDVTLQGKDNLTIKAIGDEKLNWERLIRWARIFIREYQKTTFKEAFPNYLNLQKIPEEIENKLNGILIEMLKKHQFDKIHLAIPEFISNDRFGFSYSNKKVQNNLVFQYVDIAHLADDKVVKPDQLTVDKLAKIKVYAYSYEQDEILGYRNWSLFKCIVAEVELDGEYFILSKGQWKKIDTDLHKEITTFVDEVIKEEDVAEEYANICILNDKKDQNREEVFNKIYCDKSENAILFDQAKLKIGNSRRDKEFCDILEYHQDSPAAIIHVKKHKDSSAINQLFSQARFYSEFFLGDKVFLKEIRNHIDQSNKPVKDLMMQHVKDDISKVYGGEYAVKLWLLYDNKKDKPTKSDLPIMAKYDLKITYEKLINVLKFSSVTLSMVPVDMPNIIKNKKAS